MSDVKFPVVGLDPGKTGAFCFRSPSFIKTFKTKSWLHCPQLLLEAIKRCMVNCGWYGLEVPFVVREDVHAMPADSKHNAFTFGDVTGWGRCLLHLIGQKDPSMVTPQQWQKAFALGGPYATKALRKAAHKKVAQAIVDAVCKEPFKVTLDDCDAVLIAEYRWRQLYGDLKK